MELYIKNQGIFEEYGIRDFNKIQQSWTEPHRFYHTEQHLAKLLRGIEEIYQKKEITQEERKILLLAAYYHDIVYDPTKTDNEEKSVEVFLADVQSMTHADHITRVKTIILDTKNHQPQDKLSKVFSELDMRVVTHSDFSELLQWEQQIFKEYQHLDYDLYRMGRLHLLRQFSSNYPENASNLQHLISFVQEYRPKIGVYPGSFNPFHNGHLNILEKAENIFDKVIIARGINPDKQDISTDPLELETLKYRQTENFTGFLTEYLTKKEKNSEITLVRGLRNGDDLDYEVNQLRFMEDMKEGVKIVFITCDKEYEHISSSSIKNLNRIRPGFSEKYLPK